MRDFTLTVYDRLLQELLRGEYAFQTVEDFIKSPKDKVVILRHDIDQLPRNALVMAGIEHDLNIRASYYFRAVPHVFNEDIMKQIAAWNHETAYHYEDVSLVGSKKYVGGSKKVVVSSRNYISREELMDLAYVSFCENLEKLRKIADVRTICMHGSPLSRWDNRMLWEKYDYRDVGIIAEPYFDIDFSKVLYLTDTGRRWDGDRVNVRDRVSSKEYGVGSKKNKKEEKRIGDKNLKRPLNDKFRFHSTFDIIKSVENGDFPEKVMITTHPQRWTDKPLPWAKELSWQNVKNLGKRLLIRSQK